MSWKKIIKIEVRSLSDAKRVGNEYAFEDMLEDKILSQEDYNKLNNKQKEKYHLRIAQFYAKYGDGESKEAKFHKKNAGRYLNNPSIAVNKPKPTTEKDFESKKGRYVKRYSKLSPAEKEKIWREKNPNDVRGHNINPETGLPKRRIFGPIKEGQARQEGWKSGVKRGRKRKEAFKQRHKSKGKRGDYIKRYNKLSPAEKEKLWRERNPDDIRGTAINPKTGLPSRRVYGPLKESTARLYGWKSGVSRGRRAITQEEKEKKKAPKVNQMIVDYFKIYNARFNRNPTLQDIERDEERPLTVNEIESFKTYSKRVGNS